MLRIDKAQAIRRWQDLDKYVGNGKVEKTMKKTDRNIVSMSIKNFLHIIFFEFSVFGLKEQGFNIIIMKNYSY